VGGYDRREHLPVYHFTFEDSPLAGFEFATHPPSYEGEHAALLLMAAEAPGASAARWLLALRPVLLDLGHALHSWNLTRGGLPVEPCAAELLRLDRPMLVEMLTQWRATLTTPPAPAHSGAPAREDHEPVDAPDADEVFALDIPQTTGV
jgi:hypothetical protein